MARSIAALFNERYGAADTDHLDLCSGCESLGVILSAGGPNLAFNLNDARRFLVDDALLNYAYLADDKVVFGAPDSKVHSFSAYQWAQHEQRHHGDRESQCAD